MGWLLRHNWLWALLAFLLGAVITWFLLGRREQLAREQEVAEEPAEEKVEEKAEELVGVGASTPHAAPPRRPEPPTRPERPERAKRPEPTKSAEPAEAKPVVPARPAFSRRMDLVQESTEPTLFDDPEPPAPEVQEDNAVPPGRYGEGSAEAVPHQGPPDGFTIKGNAQSMLFHTPDSPYYGRTKPEVWFRTEADAERAGFSKYVRKPRKSQR